MVVTSIALVDDGMTKECRVACTARDEGGCTRMQGQRSKALIARRMFVQASQASTWPRTIGRARRFEGAALGSRVTPRGIREYTDLTIGTPSSSMLLPFGNNSAALAQGGCRWPEQEANQNLTYAHARCDTSSGQGHAGYGGSIRACGGRCRSNYELERWCHAEMPCCWLPCCWRSAPIKPE